MNNVQRHTYSGVSASQRKAFECCAAVIKEGSAGSKAGHVKGMGTRYNCRSHHLLPWIVLVNMCPENRSRLGVSAVYALTGGVKCVLGTRWICLYNLYSLYVQLRDLLACSTRGGPTHVAGRGRHHRNGGGGRGFELGRRVNGKQCTCALRICCVS